MIKTNVKNYENILNLKLLTGRTPSTNRTDYVVTNDLTQNSIDDVQNVYGVRWKIEEFHRELKQLTGVENANAELLEFKGTI